MTRRRYPLVIDARVRIAWRCHGWRWAWIIRYRRAAGGLETTLAAWPSYDSAAAAAADMLAELAILAELAHADDHQPEPAR